MSDAERKQLAIELAEDILAGLDDAVTGGFHLDNADAVLSHALKACRGKQVAAQQSYELGNMRHRFNEASKMLYEHHRDPRTSDVERQFLDRLHRVLLGETTQADPVSPAPPQARGSAEVAESAGANGGTRTPTVLPTGT